MGGLDRISEPWDPRREFNSITLAALAFSVSERYRAVASSGLACNALDGQPTYAAVPSPFSHHNALAFSVRKSCGNVSGLLLRVKAPCLVTLRAPRSTLRVAINEIQLEHGLFISFLDYISHCESSSELRSLCTISDAVGRACPSTPNESERVFQPFQGDFTISIINLWLVLDAGITLAIHPPGSPVTE